MTKLESLKCPECGATLNFEPDQEYCFCSHCGHQVYKEDVHFDKKIELKLAEMEKDSRDLKIALIFFCIIIVISLVGLLLMNLTI